jgi:tetratricopeptide (TPR) repeat protein
LRCLTQLEAVVARDTLPAGLRGRAALIVGTYRSFRSPTRASRDWLGLAVELCATAGDEEGEARARFTRVSRHAEAFAAYDLAEADVGWLEAHPATSIHRAEVLGVRALIDGGEGLFDAADAALAAAHTSVEAGDVDPDRAAELRADLLATELNFNVYRGRLDNQRALVAEAATIYRALGDQRGLSNLYRTMAVSASVAGEGLPILHDVLAETEQPDPRHDPYEAARLHLNLGVAYLTLGEDERAHRELHEAEVLAHEHGYVHLECIALGNRAGVHLMSGQLEAAEKALVRADLRLTGAKAKASAAFVAYVWGVASLLRDDLGGAERLLAEAMTGVHEAFLVAAYRAHWALAIGLAGRYDEALAALAEAHDTLTAHRNPHQAAAVQVFCDVLVTARAIEELAMRRPEAIERLRRPLETAARLAAAPARGRDALWSGLRLARILLDRQLARGPRVAPPTVEGGEGGVLWTGPDAVWFAVGNRPPTDLMSRGPLRRLVAALIEQRIARPGVGLTHEELTRAGWPGERIFEKSAKARIRVAVLTLRKEGLREVLQTDGAAYLLDPGVSIVVERHVKED